MIKIENTEIFGWKMAIAGCRNPMNSRNKSDTIWITEDGNFYDINGNSGPYYNSEEGIDEYNFDPFYAGMRIGPADHKLLMNLCKGGTEESKWRRMVHVQMDVTAPLYWWKEFETYKVGTVSNSCSTMHKIHAKKFTLDDFSCEHLFTGRIKDYDLSEYHRLEKEEVDKVDEMSYEEYQAYDFKYADVHEYIVRELGAYESYTDYSECGSDIEIENYSIDLLKETLYVLNHYREKFLETKDKRYWWQMIQLLPSSYNQKRTIDLNYEVLAAQYRQRKDHKLDEWREYCSWIKSLPYSEFITVETNDHLEAE